MKIALFQPPYSNAAETMSFLRKEMTYRVQEGFDLFLLPEYSNCTGIEDPVELSCFIDNSGRDFINELEAFSRRHNISIAAGIVERDADGAIYNRLRLWDATQKQSKKIDKAHLTDTECKMGLTAAETIETLEFQNLRIGALICFDLYFPEYAAELSRRGVDLILAPAYQRGETAERLRLISAARALDSGAWLARASYAVPGTNGLAGRSLLASPAGEIKAALDGEPGVLCVSCDPSRKFSKPACFGGAQIEHRDLIAKKRRPALYRTAPAWFEERERPRLCAHRGLSRAMPENTVEAFAAAIAAGAHEIEFDLHCAVDGTAVVSHDPDLTRVAGIKCRVDEMTWSEIRRLNLGDVYGEQWNGIHIPRLEEILNLVSDGKTGLNIHLKTPGPNGALLRLLNKELIERNLLTQAYIGGECDVLEAAIELAPKIPRSCMAFQQDPQKQVDFAIRYNCRYLQFYTNFRTEDTVRAHKAGIRCNLFWADDYASASKAVSDGIDTILSNAVPELLSAPQSIFL